MTEFPAIIAGNFGEVAAAAPGFSTRTSGAPRPTGPRGACISIGLRFSNLTLVALSLGLIIVLLLIIDSSDFRNVRHGE